MEQQAERTAYAVCAGVTHVNGAPVTGSPVLLTAAEAAFDLAHGRIRRVEAVATTRRRRKARVHDRD